MPRCRSKLTVLRAAADQFEALRPLALLLIIQAMLLCHDLTRACE